MNYNFESKLWLYDGPSAWVFVSLPKDISAEIKSNFGNNSAGFGSIRVTVTIGQTSWQTSIFPDNQQGCYLLPIKKDVRKKENLEPNKKAKIKLALDIH